MNVSYERKFKKQYLKADKKIQAEFDKKVKQFKKHPFHPQLKNHLLPGQYKNYRSINITGDWRAIYKEEKDATVFLFLGTHSQLYK